MAYIGNQIRQYSDRVVLDSLTASATANYTLQLNGSNYVPSSAESLTVSLNGVIQKPQNSYTVSGSTLSFASALTASDSIDFVIAERGITLQTPSAGSVNTEQLASNAVTTAKIADDAVTKDKLSAHNYPAFEAYRSANIVITNNTTTKIPINTKVFDTDGYYDNTTNYRFTPLVAGKYYFYASIYGFASSANNLESVQIYFFKNGSQYKGTLYANSSSSGSYTKTPYIHAIIDMNGTTDYLETYTLLESISGSNPLILSNAIDKQTSFGGFRIGD